MEVAIQVVGWLGIAGALLLTLVILKEVALVVRELRAIDELARLTRDAARGLASNAAAGRTLSGAHEPARHVVRAARALESVCGSLRRRLDAPTGGTRPAAG